MLPTTFWIKNWRFQFRAASLWLGWESLDALKWNLQVLIQDGVCPRIGSITPCPIPQDSSELCVFDVGTFLERF